MSLKVTYIGHATTLIRWDPFCFLTDPVFSSRILCFRRLKPSNFDPSHLPKLDAVLVTHAHYDHLDLFSYKYIPSDVSIFIPEGMSKAIHPYVNNPIIELATWSSFPLNDSSPLAAGSPSPSPLACPERSRRVGEGRVRGMGITIYAIPTRHPGGRLLFPFRFRKCHGYLLQRGKEIVYFSGDTGYGPHFSKIASLFPIKLAILPIARFKNNWIQKNRHMSVQEVLQAWSDLGKPHWIPIHWGTYSGVFGNSKAVGFLKKQMESSSELKEKLHIVEHGETFTLE